MGTGHVCFGKFNETSIKYKEIKNNEIKTKHYKVLGGNFSVKLLWV